MREQHTKEQQMFIRWVCALFLIICPGKAGAEAAFAGNARVVRLVLGFETGMLTDMELNEKDTKAAMDLWMAAVARRINLVGTTRFYERPEVIMTELTAGRLDMAMMGPLNFLRVAEKADPVVAYGNVKNGKKTCKYLLLVRSDSGIVSPSALKGKNLAMKKGDETGLLILNTLLLRNGHQEARKYFMTIRKKRKLSQATLAVFFGQAHACITTDIAFDIMAELNPQVGKQLRVIYASPEIVNIVTFFRKGYSESAREIINDEVFNMKNTAYGKQVLTLFKIDGLTKLNVSDMDSLKTILTEYEKYKKE